MFLPWLDVHLWKLIRTGFAIKWPSPFLISRFIAPYKGWWAVPTLQMYLHLRNAAADMQPFSVIDIVYGNFILKIVIESNGNAIGRITPVGLIGKTVY